MNKILTSLLLAFLVFSLAANFPLAHCSSAVNIAGMDKPTSLPPASGTEPIYLSQSFKAPGDGMNLSTIVLPLSRWYTLYANTTPGVLVVDIYPMLAGTPGHIDFSGFPLAEAYTVGASLVTERTTDPFMNFTQDISNIRWQVFSITPIFLVPNGDYCIAVHNTNFTANAGFAWWANAEYNMVPYSGWAVMYFTAPPPGYSSMATIDNLYAFGFELLETSSTYIALPFDANIVISLFLSLGLGTIGFGMGKGKDSTPAIFLIYLGLVVSWLFGWLPAWILASSFAVLAIMMAYKFKGVIANR